MVHARVGALALTALALWGCDQPFPTASADSGVPAQRAELDVDHCAFGQSFTLTAINPYYPLGVGSEWLLEGEDQGAELRLRVRVLNETQVVGGVVTRVVAETEWEDDELIEVSRNFFALTADGTVCYFGEEVDIYENGQIVSHEGAWRADDAGNFPGIIMPAAPRPGLQFLMEGAPGIAEDVGRVVGTGRVTTPAGTFAESIRIREAGAHPGDFDFKIFAQDVGIVGDGPLSLISYSVN